MSYQTTSVFDALELDTTTQRLAARNALALAHIRVENHLGAFLSGALTEEEFSARLASVKPEMDSYVATACEECGHDKPEHITASLIDNYRVNRRWQPRVAYPQYPEPYGAQPADQPIDPALAMQSQDPGMQMPQGQPQAPMVPEMDPMMDPMQQMQPPIDPMMQQPQQAFASEGKQSLPFDRTAVGPVTEQGQAGMGWDPNIQQQAQQQQGQQALDAGFTTGEGPGAMGVSPATGLAGQQQYQEGALNRLQQDQLPGLQLTQNPYDYSQMNMPWGMAGKGAATNPSDQEPTDNKQVTCPACGGNGKTANKSECPKCHGSGKVGNFGDSVLDKVTSVQEPIARRWTPVVAAGNTDLGGPEPKIDKAHSNPGPPEDESKDHPTKRKDILEPIIMTNRSEDGHELKEIGEQTTEHKDLPSGGVTDHGFYDGGETSGPHTKTFGDGKHADPVTHEKQ